MAVVGTGVIGAGWIIRCLAHGKIVHAYDKNFKLKRNLLFEIKRTWPFVKKLFNKKKLDFKNFKYFTSLKEALNDVDFVQECAPENYSIKIKLINSISKNIKKNIIISSSSSGLLPSKIGPISNKEIFSSPLSIFSVFIDIFPVDILFFSIL